MNPNRGLIDAGALTHRQVKANTVRGPIKQ